VIRERSSHATLVRVAAAREPERRPPRGYRAIRQFTEGPASIRNAIRAVVAATVAATLLGGVLAFVFDRHDFPRLSDALWWSLQTVTTVGYGDVTPTTGFGRILGAFVLLYSVAFLSILTAAITTSLIERQDRRSDVHPTEGIAAVADRLDELVTRLERIERALEPRPPDGAI
jgi:voltage-gated potassium channel